MDRLRTRLPEQPRRQTPFQFAVHGVGVSRRPGPVERKGLCRARSLRLRGMARENMRMQRRLDIAEHRVINARSHGDLHQSIPDQRHV